MEKYHNLTEIPIEISKAIANHSADLVIAYKNVDSEPIRLGYFFPKNYSKTEKYPLFVFVHGGGWAAHKVFSDQPDWQGDYLGYLARYYADKGFISVSIDYRLSRDLGQAENYGIIECYEDCCDAMDYVLTHAEEYGIDVKKIFLLGESAGGHLAGSLTTFRYDRKYTFKTAFLINAITHFNDKWSIYVPKMSNHSRIKLLSLEERTEFLSPLYQIPSDICEVVLIHGTEDPTVNPEHSIMFYKKMVELGHHCELHLLEKTKHAFILAEYYKWGINACKMAISIINEKLETNDN